MKRKPLAKKTLISILLSSLITLSLASCSNDTKDTAFLDQIPEVEAYSEDTEVSEEVSEEITEEGYTQRPIVTHQFNMEPNTLIVAGTCEENSTIKASNLSSSQVVETKSQGKYFIMEISLEGNNEQHYEMTAITDGKKESKVYSFSAKFDAVAEKPADGTAVTVGNDSTLFYDSLINGYKGTNLLTNTQLNEFKDKIQGQVTNSGVKYVYVMLPSVLTVYDEKIPEDITKDTYNTKYQQISKTLSEVEGVDVIDLTQTFIDNKNGDYPLYYNTSSTLSDYGSYLTYQAIMDYLKTDSEASKEEQIPENAALGDEAAEDGADNTSAETPSEDVPIEIPDISSSKYIFNKVAGKGGDLISSLGIDNENFFEDYYYAQKDFVSTFPENAECTCLPSDLKIYADQETNSLFNEILEDEIFGANEAYGFKTNRENLPTAVFYRDDSANAMIPMLAEYLNNAYFVPQFNFPGNIDAYKENVKEYASESDQKVDYVFVVISEENIDLLA